MVSLVFCVSLLCEASIRNPGVFCSFYGFDPSKEKFRQHLPSKVLMLTAGHLYLQHKIDMLRGQNP